MESKSPDQLQKNIDLLEEKIENQQKIINQYKEGMEASIRCAKNIQRAMLPSIKILNEYIDTNFILYKPKDIISGDFYWMSNINNKLVLVAADCTGHGVPAALISMLGISCLNYIVNHKKIISPAEILSKLRLNVVESLQQKDYLDAKNGMDITVILIDKEKMIVEFAGAYNPLYLIRNNEMKIIKGDKMFIGFHVKMDAFTQTIFRYRDFEAKFLQEQDKNFPFTNHQIDIKKGDRLYMFSDGYADQFNDNNKEKFTIRTFQKLLKQIHKMPVNTQKEILIDEFNKWKGNNEQLDDILIIGIQI